MKNSCLYFIALFCFLNVDIVAQDASFEWVKTFGNPDDQEATVVATDDNHIYVMGRFAGTVDFDPGPGTASLVSAGGDDIFLLKMGLSGNLIWAQKFGGVNDELPGKSIDIDDLGNVYVYGSFSDTVYFGTGPNIISLTANINRPEMFILKIKPNGNLAWAKEFNYTNGGLISISEDFGFLKLNSNADVYFTASISATLDADPGTAINLVPQVLTKTICFAS